MFWPFCLLIIQALLVSSSTVNSRKLRHRAVKTAVDCSICLGQLNGVSRMSLPPCGHEFHKHCIHGWIARKRLDCPNCRETTTMDVSNIPVIPDSPKEYIGWEFGIFDAVLECFRCLGASVPGTYRSIDD